MNEVINSMLARYTCSTSQDYENALKEIMQELALLGLWRSKFFEVAAFYGGTALRILYGLDRFSEDLDFSLLSPNLDFKLSHYNEAIAAELRGVGFDVTVTSKEKNKESMIQSAFIKASTVEQLLLINVHHGVLVNVPKDQVIKIKMEVDINPPSGFSTEAKILLRPIPFSVLTYQQPDLFAGKLHALLCRPWVQRVKGRDWYDFVWYVSHKIPVRLGHLQQRLIQSGALLPEQPFDQQVLNAMLRDKINQVDFEVAKKDILPFIRDPAAVSLWSRDFFLGLSEQLGVS